MKDLLKPIGEPARHLTISTDQSGCPYVVGATVVKQPQFYLRKERYMPGTNANIGTGSK